MPWYLGPPVALVSNMRSSCLRLFVAVPPGCYRPTRGPLLQQSAGNVTKAELLLREIVARPNRVLQPFEAQRWSEAVPDPMLRFNE